jgi:predicted MFS family arabinose efflux permease
VPNPDDTTQHRPEDTSARPDSGAGKAARTPTIGRSAREDDTALRRRGPSGEVRSVWAAYAISQAGSGIGTGALPMVAILLLDASDWQISVLAAVAGIAGAVAVVPLGPWVEFHRKRPIMVGADLLRGVTLLSVPVAAWAGGLTFGQLCVVAAAQTVGTIVSSAASTALLKSLVPGDQLVLINARWESTMWTAGTLGPPAGGMLVSWLGALAALLVDAASFLLSALTLGRIRHRELVPAAPEDGRHSMAEMTAGWRHIAAHPVLLRLFGHAMVFGGCIVASTPLIAVLMLRDLGFSPAQYGLALGVPCAAGVLGSVLASRIIGRAGLMPTLLVAGAARCVWMAAIPFAPATTGGLVLIIAADTLLLLCAGVFSPLTPAVSQFSPLRLHAQPEPTLAALRPGSTPMVASQFRELSQ